MNLYKNIFDFNIRWNWKTVSLFLMLAAFPNILGAFHGSVFGVRIHFFQYLIFLAAVIYGPFGGAISGAFGSVYTALALNNPYIVVGNIILGFFVGFFVRKGLNAVVAVLMAYAIQLPWLWVTDVYLAHMPVGVVNMIVIALLISNIIWGVFAWLTAKQIKRFVIA